MVSITTLVVMRLLRKNSMRFVQMVERVMFLMANITISMVMK